jgi:hypothetical protein
MEDNIDNPESKSEYVAEFFAIMLVGFFGTFGCALLCRLFLYISGLN